MSARKINKDEHPRIVDLYKNGYSKQKIADIYNVSSTTIGTILKNNNIKCTSKKIPESEYDNIISLYLNGFSTLHIAKEYGVCDVTIDKILDSRDIKRRNSWDYSRKYTFNEHYFDEFTSHNQAYILGLLYADGCNYPPHNKIGIELQEQDKDILEKINCELNNEKPLKFCNRKKYHSTYQNTYSIELFSQYFSSVVGSLGVLPQKSLILSFPEWLDTDLYSSFLLGYSDGDGCISKDVVRASWSIVGTEEFCGRVASILTEFVGIDKYILYTPRPSKENQSNTRTLCVNGITNVKRVLDWLYSNSKLYMQRKYDIYKSLYCNET